MTAFDEANRLATRVYVGPFELAEQDSSDKPTTLTVTDDLKKPVTFSGDRERLLIVGSIALK